MSVASEARSAREYRPRLRRSNFPMAAVSAWSLSCFLRLRCLFFLLPSRIRHFLLQRGSALWARGFIKYLLHRGQRKRYADQCDATSLRVSDPKCHSTATKASAVGGSEKLAAAGVYGLMDRSCGWFLPKN